MAVKHWLFSYNPDSTDIDLDSYRQKIANAEEAVIAWSCSNQLPKEGDIAWVVRTSQRPKGIFAKGRIMGEPYSSDSGDSDRYVDIKFESIADIYKEPYIKESNLKDCTIDNQHWYPQKAGIELKPRSALFVEQLWKRLNHPTYEQSQVKPMTLATNEIYYGPPGTGKTYKLSAIKKAYTSEKQSISKEQWLAESLREVRWFEVVLMALVDLGGKAKVPQLTEHPFVQAKLKAVGRVNNLAQTLWGILQLHSNPDSLTVKMKNRNQPTIFDKGDHSQWFLMPEYEDECSDTLQLLEKLNNGQQANESVHRYEFVTFHQAYSYEDFVEGIRPVQDEDNGEMIYRVEPGVFKRICQRAENDPENRYAMFIDEINRGNIAKIFGELITLIEPDKRLNCENQVCVTLPYSGQHFGVPANLDIYGTMNTADRSIALLDTALRRRFRFREMLPDSTLIKGSRGDGYIEDGAGSVINVRQLFEVINQRIRFLLNRDVVLGHAYFTAIVHVDDLKRVLLDQVIPLLQEYFYEDWSRIQLVLGGDNPLNLISKTTLTADSLGFSSDDFDDIEEYEVIAFADLTPEHIRAIAQVAESE